MCYIAKHMCYIAKHMCYFEIKARHVAAQTSK